MSYEVDDRKKRYSLSQTCGFFDHSVIRSTRLLPPEILINVFYLLCNTQTPRCSSAAQLLDKASRPFFKQPIILSHVCSYWRHIAINLPLLWSHIDLFPDQYRDPILSARSETFAARSAHVPLDLHIIIHPVEPVLRFYAPPEADSDSTIFPFLTAVAHRVWSLTVTSDSGRFDDDGGFCGLVLAAIFTDCTPGALTAVSIVACIELYSDYAVNAHTLDSSWTEATIDDLWLPVTILQLSGYFVKWDSKAYHGLAELRLSDCGTPNSSILTSIFQSSPQLRVLELDRFEGRIHEDSLLSPVPLDKLEVLMLAAIPDGHFASILRLITPGSKPITLSISNPHEYSTGFISRRELQKFVARSNISRLCVYASWSYTQISDVLSIMPSVHVLALNNFCLVGDEEDALITSTLPLDTIYILRSMGTFSFTWDRIERLVKRYDVQKLIFWKHNFRYSGLGEPNQERMPGNLYTVCPVVKVIPDYEANPIED
ncbi:hypothetical protein B0J17DRAFT_682526 [Rhizoctonia solani]|nr:hypothetical protein B0J17DRAFT_682526 [Rhizoctonia solani]